MNHAEGLLRSYSLGAGKGYRASSLKVYGAILRQLESLAIAEEETLLEASPATIEKFLAKQSNRNTAKRYAWFLADFFEYFVDEKIITSSGASGLREKYSYPEKVSTPSGISDDDKVQRFLACLPAPRTWKKARDAALLAMSLGTGLKLKELLVLGVRDVFADKDNPLVLVHHRHASRAVPIRSEALPYIEKWLQVRSEQTSLKDVQEFFPAALEGGRLAASTVWRQSRKVLAEAGLDELAHFGTSALRVSYARLEADDGSKLPILQHRLGHKLESSTVHLLGTPAD